MDASKLFGKRYYRPELNVVRFLAFILVFLNHTLPDSPDPRAAAIVKGFAPVLYDIVRACSFGLSLFFTLSAFLICELLLREREAAGSIGVKQFYIRRILRIWPLYYLGVALGVVAALLPGVDRASAAQMGWFALFLGAWQSAVHGWVDNPMAPLWSISVEEQFYLFAPWVVKVSSRKSLYGFCAVLILVSNGWLYYFGASHVSDNRVWADSFVQFECFAAGILLCLVLHGQLPRIAAWQRLLLLAGGGSCWFFACHGLHSQFGAASENPGYWSLIGGYALASLGSVMVLVAFLGLNPKLLPEWAVYLGRISFGLYIFHLLAVKVTYDVFPPTHSYHLLLFFLKICIAFGLSVLMAGISYRYFETPFLKMKKRHAVIENQPI